MPKLLFVGLDVHADTIAVAVAEQGGEVRAHGIIPNRLESVRKLIHKLGPVQHLRACYEAGPTGYVLYWQLTQLGVVRGKNKNQTVTAVGREMLGFIWAIARQAEKQHKLATAA